MTLVCSAEYTSAKFIGVGDAPIAVKNEVSMGAGGTRILNPFISSGVLIWRVEEVTWRKPLSQILPNATRPVLSMRPRV